jgi:hypothetical protein
MLIAEKHGRPIGKHQLNVGGGFPNSAAVSTRGSKKDLKGQEESRLSVSY